MFDVGQQKFLMLLLVVEAKDRAADNLVTCRVRRICQQDGHGVIHIGAVAVDLCHRGARKHAAFSTGEKRTKAFIIRIEDVGEGRVINLIALLVWPEDQLLIKPCGVRQMPLGGAGVRHGLHAVILQLKRFTKRLAVRTHAREIVGNIRGCGV